MESSEVIPWNLQHFDRSTKERLPALHSSLPRHLRSSLRDPLRNVRYAGRLVSLLGVEQHSWYSIFIRHSRGFVRSQQTRIHPKLCGYKRCEVRGGCLSHHRVDECVRQWNVIERAWRINEEDTLDSQPSGSQLTSDLICSNTTKRPA